MSSAEKKAGDTIFSFTILPIQRIPRYVLLLQEASLSHTFYAHTFHFSSIKQMHDFLSCVNGYTILYTHTFFRFSLISFLLSSHRLFTNSFTALFIEECVFFPTVTFLRSLSCTKSPLWVTQSTSPLKTLLTPSKYLPFFPLLAYLLHISFFYFISFLHTPSSLTRYFSPSLSSLLPPSLLFFLSSNFHHSQSLFSLESCAHAQ